MRPELPDDLGLIGLAALFAAAVYVVGWLIGTMGSAALHGTAAAALGGLAR